MNSIASLTARQLRRAANLKERIESLTQQLETLLGASAGTNGGLVSAKRKMSAAGRARIAAAARARWAKIKGTAQQTQPKRKMSAAGRARLAAAARERWKRAKAEGKTTL